MTALRARRGYFVALLTGLLFVVGVAAAQWLASGTGSGYAQARDSDPLATVDVSNSTIGDLYPGGTGDMTLRIVNPNPYPVTVAAVTGAGTITSDTSGCGSDHGVTFADQTGLSLAVPAGEAATHVLPGVVAMAATSPPACEGAGFTILVALAGSSGTGDGLVAYYDGPQGTEGVGECRAGTKDADGNVVTPAVVPTTEVADGIDNDCDGAVDEGLVSCDDGDPATVDTVDSSSGTCSHQFYPAGTACDDGDPSTAGEVWDGTGTCGGGSVDADRDGYDSSIDCDDANANINPGAVEVAGNGIDDDCDGFVDEG